MLSTSHLNFTDGADHKFFPMISRPARPPLTILSPAPLLSCLANCQGRTGHFKGHLLDRVQINDIGSLAHSNHSM